MRRTTMLAALAVLLAAPAALAWPGGPGKGHGRRMARALDLSEEQQEAVQALRKDMREELGDVRAVLREKREELAELWRAETPDRTAILAKMAELDGLRQSVRTRRVDFRLAVHALLTPEQRERAAELFARRGPGRHGRRHGRGHGPGFGPGPGFGGGDCPCLAE